MSGTTRSPSAPASPRRLIGAALGLVLVVAAAPFLRSAAAAQPTGDPQAAGETAVVAGAEAVDPAIWVNPSDATKSLILGANDTRLVTYDMAGAVVAQAGVPEGTTAGDVTGVDVRDAVSVGTRLVGDVATVVGNGIIRFYAIDPATGLLTDVGGRTLAPAEWHSGKPSKVCMYQSPVSAKTYAFLMSDNGEMAQYELIDNAGTVDLQMVRGGLSAAAVWDVTEVGTVSGCAADDELKALYVSETAKGILKIGAEPTDPTTGTLIDTPAPAGHLLPSVKGLAIAKTGETAGYLMAATVAPGATVTESFTVYDRADGNAYIRTFTVPAGGAADKCDLSDGIDAAAGNFGTAFSAGMFLCQDKRNRPATGGGTEANNYKMARLDQIVDMTPPALPTTTTMPQVTPTTTPAVQVPSRSGYWMVGIDGRVYNFGDAKSFGDAAVPAGASAVDLEPTPSGNGYWIIDDLGNVYARGDAKALGHVDRGLITGTEIVTSLSATRSGNGYWVFTSLGRVIPFGDATFHGDMRNTKLNGAVLDSIATASGKGYYMVGSDGGIFSFGDAVFKGSMGGKPLNKPVQSLVPDGDGSGYWLVASDGGIFAFEAPFKGSMGAIKLNKPVTGMVRYGDGYLMVGEDGGIFSFSTKQFVGSLGDNPPARPITSVAVLDTPAAP